MGCGQRPASKKLPCQHTGLSAGQPCVRSTPSGNLEEIRQNTVVPVKGFAKYITGSPL